ncbi:MAG: PhzF family phenazine biosynthesis protein [Roseivirga sp.]|nr:PhzF family phenazine biosynthesis protein [Roseivirga sp.]
MQLDLYQIDAFTETIFSGNPACVVPLTHWLPDDLLLQITQENAVAETAFFIPGEDKIALRWFTPEIEMDLCGHATLATVHVLKSILDYPKDEMIFSTLSGDLRVRAKDGLYTMNFPSRKPVPANLPAVIEKSLSKQPKAVFKARDYVLVYENEEDIRNIIIDRQVLDQINLDPGGVIVTAPGHQSDFVSRFFTPQASILEDPVTGSAHCSLIPYWAEQLGKTDMIAFQLSERGGQLTCQNKGDRVLISGNARTYATGVLNID